MTSLQPAAWKCCHACRQHRCDQICRSLRFPLSTLARYLAFFGNSSAILPSSWPISCHYSSTLTSKHPLLSIKHNEILENTEMLVKSVLLAATLSTTVFTVPLPLHDTNTQRLPDHPAAVNHSDYPAIVMAQKHKYVPEIAATILRLCGRGLRH